MNAERRKRRKGSPLLVIVLILGLVAAAVVVFFRAFLIEDVRVEGNLRYTEDEIKSLCMVGPLAQNSILMSVFQKQIDLSDRAFLDHVSVEYIDRHSILLRVKETNLVGMFEIRGYYYYFDQYGKVTEVLTEPDEEEGKYVPKIIGLGASNIGLEHVIVFEEPQALNTITAIRNVIARYEICPDIVEFDADMNITLHYGDITALLGPDVLLEEKMIRVGGILPHLEGYKGVLHLENFTRDTENIVFDSEEVLNEDEDTDPTYEELWEAENAEWLEEEEYPEETAGTDENASEGEAAGTDGAAPEGEAAGTDGAASEGEAAVTDGTASEGEAVGTDPAVSEGEAVGTDPAVSDGETSEMDGSTPEDSTDSGPQE